MPMHWGFWKGDMEIELKRRSFRPGDVIEGVVRFELKKPTKARGFWVQLKGEEIIKTRRRGSDGKVATHMDTVVICDVKERLGEEREYLKEEIPFRIRIPSNVMREGRDSAIQGALEGAIEVLTGRSERSEFQWYLKANLDIPKAIDVSRTEKISIYE